MVLTDQAAAAEALLHADRAERAATIGKALAILALCDQARVNEDALAVGAERWLQVGADGTPTVAEFVAGEIAALIGVSVGAVFARMATLLNLRHRHPTLFELVTDGTIALWEACRVADEASLAGLDAAACRQLDRHCAVALAHQSWQRVRPQIAGWIIRADPRAAAERAERAAASRYVSVDQIRDGHCDVWGRLDARDGLDLDQALDHVGGVVATEAPVAVRRAIALGALARYALGQESLPPAPCAGEAGAPGATDAGVRPSSLDGLAAGPLHPRVGRSAELIVRLDGEALRDPARGVAAIERWGSLLAGQLPELLRGAKVTVRPVVVADAMTGVDGYVPPATMRLAVQERNPVDVFPFGRTASRRCDLDHTVAYDPSAPPGSRQTRPGNLAPLSRFAHRLKTHGGWRMSQPEPGVVEWASPLGYRYRCTATGSVLIGQPPPRTYQWWHREPPDDGVSEPEACEGNEGPDRLDGLPRRADPRRATAETPPFAAELLQSSAAAA